MAIRGWRLGVTAAVAVLAALCASAPDPLQLVRTASDLGPLPADRYGFTTRDYGRSQRATALLVRQCMADKGHPDFPLDPRDPRDITGTTAVGIAVGTDYGVLDPDAARRWGYGWDPAKDAAARPKGRRMTIAEYTDLPECRNEAEQRVGRGVDFGEDWLYAVKRGLEVGTAVERDPRVRAAWDAWSRCVAARGFTRYPDPVAAYTDDAWRRNADGNTRHTERERATAVADAGCKRRLHTAEIWHAVQAREQTADIARHRDHYAAAQRAMRRYRANVDTVLRDLG
ncbi:hypothetical protein ABZ479_39630 [Streptomyces sp. NPDC005722]